MGTVAQKITYLGETKSILKDTINMSNANITNSTTFRNYAMQLKEGYIDILNNGTDTLYNNFTHLTGKGMTLSFAPTYQAPMKITCYGSTSQASTPTPSSPVDVVNTTGNQSIEICKTNLAYTDWASDFVSRINDNTKAKLETYDNKNCLFYAASAGYQEYDTKYLFKTNWKENTQYTISGYIKPSVANITNLAVVYIDGTYTPINTTLSANTWGYFSYTTLSNKTIKYFRINWSSGNCYLDLDTFMIYEGTDTTTPYEAYNGTNYNIGLTSKNLFNKNNVTYGKRLTSAGVEYNDANYFLSNFIKVSPSTNYVKNSPTADAYHRFAFYSSASENDFISASNDNSITTPSTCIYLRFCGLLSEIDITQLEKGSSSTNYVDYFTPIELCKIGDYEDKIDKSTGKNLFDGEIELGSINPRDGINTGSTSRTRSKNFIEVEPNTTYTFKRNVGQNRWIIGYTENKIGITDGNYSGYASALSMSQDMLAFTFTTTSTTKYIKWYDTNSTDLNEEVMLNKGDTALPYEPYGTDWYLKKNIGKVVLDGTENWEHYSVTQGDLFRTTRITDDTTDNTYTPYSNYFIGLANAISSQRENGKFYINAVNNTTDFIDNRFTSANDFKTWLSTHNTEVYYVLATPTYTKITDSTLIEQLEAIKSKDNTTNITSSMVIGAIALKKE